MSKDIKHKIRMIYPDYHPESPAYSDIWLDNIEYNDLLRSLRATDEPKSVWIRDIDGINYNFNMVFAFKLLESVEIESSII